MSGVDVLAVMDRQRELTARTGSSEDLLNLSQARAALAELVEAAGDALDCESVHSWTALPWERRAELLARYGCAPGMRPVRAAADRLRAALARVEGAK